MPLTFDFSDMISRVGREEFDKRTDHPTEAGKWHPVTDALIWASMATGVPALKDEATADKFADRLLAYQAISGGDILTSTGRVVITREDVHAHIGMRTNASTLTDAQFAKNLARVAIDEGERLARQQGAAFDKIAGLAAEQGS
jgi:hypothetical protein